MRHRVHTVLEPDDVMEDADLAPDADPDASADDEVVDGDQPVPLGTGRKRRLSQRTAATAVIVTIVVALGALAGWLGWQAKSLHEKGAREAVFVQVARQAAVNLTTISFEHAEADVQRITNGATGAFYDDFSNRSKPFIDVVQKVKSKSAGTVTAAGLESASRDDARVLVAVSVKTSTAAEPQEQLRAWRLRVTVTRMGEEVKVSNVEFVV